MLIDVDFSENFKYNETCNEVQSANWVTKSVTLFVCVAKWLDTAVWSATPQFRLEGMEVSVALEGDEDDGQGTMYRYGRVEKDWKGIGPVEVYHPTLYGTKCYGGEFDL